MGKFQVVRLRPKGPVTGIPHADTLFGAIANALATLDGGKAVEELLWAFKEGARISSAFPYSGDTYYLPKPLTVELMDFGGDTARVKRMKRAAYLDLENFEKALRLKPFEVPEENTHSIVDVPKVVLDRVAQDSSIYFWEEVRFRDDSGLYFLYSGPGDVFNEFIKPAVRLLGDSGIGGKSTWGFGLFEPSFESIKINAPASPYAVTLSNALPTKRPVLWRTLRKGGWSFGKRKPKMTFIAEGSVIRDDPGRVEGLEMGLPFKVYTYGLTFPLPAIIPEGLE
ncbi:type III-A CRISPR-associated RAMP protein Csm4 [Thermococcus indicus]|uniref:CRISPR system Cms protein Csm4 n=1 Tax=Thermococcus indicus TaxID=2586643 RepID=A0A4Y5SKA9_9EURY|nr:type III-A CRISPR-associated RAMP protein Csm4 [Thermococcus indicus]QDA31338.1 type III-A CRISPR-associated RAMP protein Csm4 [Thermococcus indicus]